MNPIVRAFKQEFGRDWMVMMIGFGAWCALGGVGYVLIVLYVALGRVS
jgi:hypothetical protein